MYKNIFAITLLHVTTKQIQYLKHEVLRTSDNKLWAGSLSKKSLHFRSQFLMVYFKFKAPLEK